MSLQKFLSSRKGRRFYNFAYCWGACMVIAGALFKIMHLPFDNLLLLLGMGVEIFIFFISGFDIPSAEYRWERVFPELAEDYKGELPATGKTVSKGTSSVNAASETTVSDKVPVEELANVSREAKEMSHLMHQLNDQYRQMLEAMNVKTK